MDGRILSFRALTASSFREKIQRCDRVAIRRDREERRARRRAASCTQEPSLRNQLSRPEASGAADHHRTVARAAHRRLSSLHVISTADDLVPEALTYASSPSAVDPLRQQSAAGGDLQRAARPPGQHRHESLRESRTRTRSEQHPAIGRIGPAQLPARSRRRAAQVDFLSQPPGVKRRCPDRSAIISSRARDCPSGDHPVTEGLVPSPVLRT